MEPVKINTSSWHYRFIQEHVARARWISDICEYRKAFVKALFLATFKYTILIALFCTAMFVVSGAVMGVYTFATGGELTEHMKFGMLLVGVILTTIALAIIASGTFNWLDARGHRAGAPGPMKEMYLSWKEKYCKPVQFSDE